MNVWQAYFDLQTRDDFKLGDPSRAPLNLRRGSGALPGAWASARPITAQLDDTTARCTIHPTRWYQRWRGDFALGASTKNSLEKAAVAYSSIRLRSASRWSFLISGYR